MKKFLLGIIVFASIPMMFLMGRHTAFKDISPCYKYHGADYCKKSELFVDKKGFEFIKSEIKKECGTVGSDDYLTRQLEKARRANNLHKVMTGQMKGRQK